MQIEETTYGNTYGKSYLNTECMNCNSNFLLNKKRVSDFLQMIVKFIIFHLQKYNYLICIPQIVNQIADVWEL